jgi:starch synthase
MKVLLATSEAIPYAKTGGLADVLGSLFLELRGMRMDARLIMPLYRGIKSRFHPEYSGIEINIPLGKDVYRGRIFTHNENTILIECNEFYDRKGIYGTPHGEYEDNALRYIFFSKAILEACKSLDFIPDVIHCNDWHTGLVPLYMKSAYRKYFANTASLFTIHNLEYQGIFPMSAMTLTGLKMDMFNPHVLEFYGNINLMKAGIAAADAISTVSVNYSREIREKEYGAGLDGLIRKRARDLYGIVNGIDYAEWDPSSDSHIKANFSREDLSGKKICKGFLARKFSFAKKNAPLLGMVGRISSQKGFEIFIASAERILADGVNVAILGEGEEQLQGKLGKLADGYPGSFSLNIGFDNELAHQIFAGADMLLMPSRYEPCGLTQMIAMRYGTVPVARATGGLIDTVEDYNPLDGKGTGFLFEDYGPSAIHESIRRALCSYISSDGWEKIIHACMGKDFSWNRSARRYSSLYRDIGKKVAA